MEKREESFYGPLKKREESFYGPLEELSDSKTLLLRITILERKYKELEKRLDSLLNQRISPGHRGKGFFYRIRRK